MVGAKELGLSVARKQVVKSLLVTGEGLVDNGGMPCSDENKEAAASVMLQAGR